MRCDEHKLFLYGEGACTAEEEALIRDHLETCSRCRKTYERMKFAIDCFTSYYRTEGRGSCPSADDLVRFQEGDITGSRRERIRAHIESCPGCTEELELLARCDAQEDPAAERLVHPPPLSHDVLGRIEELGKSTIKDRMENVLKALMDKGRDVLTSERIIETLERYVTGSLQAVPVHAMPLTSATSDTELSLKEPALCDISLSIQGLDLSILAIGDILTVTAMKDDTGIEGVEIAFTTPEGDVRTTITGENGSGVIEGIRQGHYRISVRVPDERKKR